jgi:hypothetical protein
MRVIGIDASKIFVYSISKTKVGKLEEGEESRV